MCFSCSRMVSCVTSVIPICGLLPSRSCSARCAWPRRTRARRISSNKKMSMLHQSRFWFSSLLCTPCPPCPAPEIDLLYTSTWTSASWPVPSLILYNYEGIATRNGNRKSGVEIPRGRPIVHSIGLGLELLLVHWESLGLGLQVLGHVVLDVLRRQVHLHGRTRWAIVVHIIGSPHLHWRWVHDWRVLDLLRNTILRMVRL